MFSQRYATQGGGLSVTELTYQMRRFRRPAHPNVAAALQRLEGEGLAHRPYEDLDSYFATTTAA